MSVDLLKATVVDLQGLLEAKKTTSEALVKAYLAQIDRHEGYLNALISMPPQSYLLNVARERDQERTVGTVRGRLHGIPVLIKDNMATDSTMQMDTTAGSLALVGSQPKRNAKVVEMVPPAPPFRLCPADQIPLAAEVWGHHHWQGQPLRVPLWIAGGLPLGVRPSPLMSKVAIEKTIASLDTNPAGSSTGSAVGVSAGYAPVSLGTETEGSLILPASRAALYTIKPTIAIVPQEGIVPITSLFDSAGPMTKSVEDLAILLDVIVDETRTSGKPVGGYVTEVTGKWDGLKIGALDPDNWRYPTFARKSEPALEMQMFDETRKAYERLKKLAPVFHEDVDLISSDEFTFKGESVIATLCAHDFGTDFEAYLRDVDNCSIAGVDDLIKFNDTHAEQELPPRNPRQDFLTGAAKSNLSTEERDEVIAHMREIGRTKGIDALFSRLEIKVLIGPAESAITQFASACGYPIASLPLGYLDAEGSNGRPHGLAAIAKAHQESTLIRLQSAWEASFPERRPPPLGS